MRFWGIHHVSAAFLQSCGDIEVDCFSDGAGVALDLILHRRCYDLIVIHAPYGGIGNEAVAGQYKGIQIINPTNHTIGASRDNRSKRQGGIKMMKKRKKAKCLMSLFLVLVMVLSLVPTNGLTLTVHAEEVDTGLCAHHKEHTEECGYIAAQTEAPFDKGHPCEYECTICSVQALIDALSDVDGITVDNAKDVENQLDVIDEAKANLTDEELEALDFAPYQAAVDALNALDEQEGAVKPLLADTSVIDVAAVTIDGETINYGYSDDSAYTTDVDALNAAWDAAKAADSAIFTLLADVNLGENGLSVLSGENITYEGGDHTLSGTGSYIINVYTGSLTINSGTIQNTTSTAYQSGVQVIWGGKLTVNGGSIKGPWGSNNSPKIGYGVLLSQVGSNEVVVNDGTINGYYGIYSYGNVTIN